MKRVKACNLEPNVLRHPALTSLRSRLMVSSFWPCFPSSATVLAASSRVRSAVCARASKWLKSCSMLRLRNFSEQQTQQRFYTFVHQPCSVQRKERQSKPESVQRATSALQLGL